MINILLKRNNKENQLRKSRPISNGARNNKGSITLELLIAFAILLINITGVILIINNGQAFSVDTQTNQEALAMAQNQIEKAKSDANLDFNLVNPISSFSSDIYTKSLLAEQIDLFTKKITSLVNWKTDGGRDQEIKLISYLTNPKAVDGGDTCSSILINPSGWKNPKYYTFPSVDFDFGAPNANGIQMSDLDIFNKRLYVTASDTPNPNPESFFVLQLSDNPSQNPTIIGKVDNNNGSLVGLKAVKVAGDYAYVANAYAGSPETCIQNNNCAQLQIIDISNPVLNGWDPAITNLKIPATTSSNKLAAGNSIFYSKGYVYIGLATASGSGNEFNIIDVGGGGLPASPTNPILKGGYPINHDINSIFVKDNFAYIASPNSENLIILDISDPANPFKTDGYTPSAGLTHGEKLTIVGNTAYLGRTFGADEFHILDVSNHNNISLVAKKDIGTSNQTSIHGLIVRDYLAFLITLNQFQIWDISNPNNMKPWTQDGTANSFLSMSILGGSGTATNCEGDRIYVAVASSQGNNKDILAVITPGVSKTNQTITVTTSSPTNAVFGSTFPVSATASSGLTVAITTTGECTISGGIVTMTSGTGNCVVHYNQTGDSNYNPATEIIETTTAQKTTPNISWANPSAITYGTALSGTQLNASTGIAGTFTYTPSIGTILNIGANQTLSVHFEPTDTANYNIPTDKTVFITVNPAFTYSISNPGPKHLIKGTPLPITITLTKQSGVAVPVTVSITNLPSNATLSSVSPTNSSCTPDNTCTITFTFNASSNANKSKTSIVNGNLTPISPQSFIFTVN